MTRILIRLSFSILLCGFLLINCGSNDSPSSNESVVIEQIGVYPNWYFKVTLNYNTGISRREMGREYAQKVKAILPDFESGYDFYLANSISESTYQVRLANIQKMKSQIPIELREEIEGMAEVFTGGSNNIRGDGKISVVEWYYAHLSLDLMMSGYCSAISVFNTKSATGNTMTARLVDWSDVYYPAVTIIKNGNKSMAIIGYLLNLNVTTGFNDDGVFLGILLAGSAPAADFDAKPIDPH